MATLVSVITLVLTGQPLTPVTVFMFLSFVNRLRRITCLFLAYGFLETYEAYASLGRIEQFLLLENLLGKSSDRRKEDVIKDQSKPTTLSVSSLTYRKLERLDEFILENIEFTTAAQKLTVITGPVGSGKSTLLSAIAGEISHTSGTIACQGSLVYVPQTAWVFSGTIRDNILFGQPYDEPKYTRVIEACALTEDIQKFPDCDQTIVGERGEVLSGGQKARVTLARAVYADADLYLMDDPLSALDLKVGQHVFEKCIRNLLGKKIRVLTSHRERHMREADEVIVLNKGRVLEKGCFSELQRRGILNKTVDPLYKKDVEEQNYHSVVWENEEKREVADSCDRMVPLPNAAKGLEIMEEDRNIGVVSSALYWDFFRSGARSLTIVVLICLCVVTQGKMNSILNVPTVNSHIIYLHFSRSERNAI